MHPPRVHVMGRGNIYVITCKTACSMPCYSLNTCACGQITCIRMRRAKFHMSVYNTLCEGGKHESGVGRPVSRSCNMLCRSTREVESCVTKDLSIQTDAAYTIIFINLLKPFTIFWQMSVAAQTGKESRGATHHRAPEQSSKFSRYAM